MIQPHLYINTQKKDPVTGLIIDNWLKADLQDKVNIVLKDSIKKSKDVGKVFTTYTNPFTLPASKRNNQIFKRFSSNKVYEGFDPRRKYSAVIKLNGVDFKKGYIKLNVVDLKDNMPLSYSIQFFGELASVKDILSDGNLRGLNNIFEYEFPYDHSVVKLGLEQGFDVQINADSGIPAIFKLQMTNGVEVAGSVLLTLQDVQYTIPLTAGGPSWTTTAIYDYMSAIPSLGYTLTIEDNGGFQNGIIFVSEDNGWHPDLIFNTNGVQYLTANVQIVQNGNSDPLESDVTIVPNNNGTFKFPLISHTRGFEYTDSGFHRIQSTVEIDDGETIDSDDRLNMYDLKPAIRVESIFDGIEQTYPIVFNKDWMFGTNANNASPIKDMYLWLHNKAGYAGYLTANGDPLLDEWERVCRYDGNGPAQGEWQLFDSQGLSDHRPFEGTAGSNYYTGTLKARDFAGEGNIVLEVWIMKEEGGIWDNSYYTFSSQVSLGDEEIELQFSLPQNDYPDAGQYEGQKWYIRTKITAASSVIQYTPELVTKRFAITNNTSVLPPTINRFSSENEFQATPHRVLDKLSASGLMPDYKCIDFLADMFKLYNLVAYEELQLDSSYKINIESYDYYMSKGNKYDITQYIDISKSSVMRISPFSMVNYKFEDPVTFLAINQKENTGDSWGNSTFNVNNFSEGVTGTNSLLFDGGEYKVEPKLEKMMYERIRKRPLGERTSIQWGWMVGNEKENLPEPTIGSPLYMFINRKQIAGEVLSSDNQFPIEWNLTNIPQDNDRQFSNWCNVPSNVTADGKQTLHFNSEFDEYIPEAGENVNSLFNNFHRNYIENIYSQYSKKIKVDAFLPPLIFSKLKLNDTIIVDNTDYFIDEMDINITTGKVKFSLLRVTNIITRIEGNNPDGEPNEDNDELWNTTEDIWSTLPQARALSQSAFAQRVIDDGGVIESEECINHKLQI